MKAIRKAALQAPAAILALSLFSGLPARAQDISVGNGTAASAATAAGPAQKLGAVADAMALAVKRKKQSMRIVRPLAPRLSSLWNQDWGCSGAWCGRPFVLMIGIGY
jgi:hypothetical protein